MARLLGSGVAIALAATVMWAAPARPRVPATGRQSFTDVAVKGLLWRGHRFADPASFNRWLGRHRTTYRAWAARHPLLSLGLWQHVLCPPHCRTALVGRSLRSWNTHVGCRPLLTTIPIILGRGRSPLGGATEAGGALQPHLTGTDKRELNPPCLVGPSTPTFVEVDGVEISQDFGTPADGDRVFNALDGLRTDLPGAMRTIHVEIDGVWRDAGVAPPTDLPPVGSTIDVQGFVYWDSEHVDNDWHSFSGWELHPLVAWRP